MTLFASRIPEFLAPIKIINQLGQYPPLKTTAKRYCESNAGKVFRSNDVWLVSQLFMASWANKKRAVPAEEGINVRRKLRLGLAVPGVL
ncbi:hypothetical protein VTH06DRAFT_4586 [Thermothelomyces fergusii]